MNDFRATHPAPGLDRASLWFGYEVEGEHAGLYTAFIAARLTTAELTRMLHEQCEQWFFTETFTDWVWYAEVAARCARPGVVTAGVMAKDVEKLLALRQADRGLHHIKLIVRVFDQPWVTRLKDCDQVSVGVPYRMTTFPVKRGIHTHPAQYEKDRV